MIELMERLKETAIHVSGGHFTVMRFSTNWRVGFGTPADRCDICALFEGKTFEEAASKALEFGDVVLNESHCLCHQKVMEEDQGL